MLEVDLEIYDPKIQCSCPNGVFFKGLCELTCPVYVFAAHEHDLDSCLLCCAFAGFFLLLLILTFEACRSPAKPISIRRCKLFSHVELSNSFVCDVRSCPKSVFFKGLCELTCPVYVFAASEQDSDSSLLSGSFAGIWSTLSVARCSS